MSLQQDRLASKQVDASQAIFHVTYQGQPRWTLITSDRPVALGQNASHDVFVDLNSDEDREAEAESLLAVIADEDDEAAETTEMTGNT